MIAYCLDDWLYLTKSGANALASRVPVDCAAVGIVIDEGKSVFDEAAVLSPLTPRV